ncbi:MAG: hypothetical protein EBX35_14085 [Planctomycetia bacterium]|nr:hypothetical protein [Planctomycetia bacterium]
MTGSVCWFPAVVGFCLLTGTAAAEFPAPRDTETDLTKQRLSPAAAAAGFRVPEGFEVGVFAAEPVGRTSPSRSGRGSSSRICGTAC